jgi:uncharacterized integral membrane protein (TIGR00697 family)
MGTFSYLCARITILPTGNPVASACINLVKNKKMKNQNVSVSFMVIGIVFCVCLVASNLLETKVCLIGGVPVAAGLLVFPISYILNDCIAEVWGYRKARLIIWMGFLMNFLIVVLTQVAIWLPADPSWQGDEAFRFVFGLTPRIAAASLIAFVVGSFLNAYVMSKMKVASQGRNFSARAILSTLAGEGADSLIFFPIAFGGLMDWPRLCQMMLFQAVAKTVYEIILLPVTIRVVKYIKRREQVDVYDESISYNVWKISEVE